MDYTKINYKKKERPITQREIQSLNERIGELEHEVHDLKDLKKSIEKLEKKASKPSNNKGGTSK